METDAPMFNENAVTDLIEHPVAEAPLVEERVLKPAQVILTAGKRKCTDGVRVCSPRIAHSLVVTAALLRSHTCS